MYGSITVPGGLGLPSGETVDKEIQDKLAHALEGLTVNMNISSKAGGGDYPDPFGGNIGKRVYGWFREYYDPDDQQSAPYCGKYYVDSSGMGIGRDNVPAASKSAGADRKAPG